MPHLRIRVYLDDKSWIGPGKVDLLEAIAEHGSISAAGRAMGMSYKRAWDLVAELNRIFGAPVAAARPGGRRGGGAELTPLGRDVVEQYRAIEQNAANAAEPHIAVLRRVRKGNVA